MPADMVSVSDTRILQISLNTFREVMSKNPGVKTKIIESAAEKVASTMIRIREQGK